MSKKTLRYDSKAKRFRGPDGRFVSYSSGIRSSTARRQYNRVPVKQRLIPKPKPKAKPKKKLIPPIKPRLIPAKKLPHYFKTNVYVGPKSKLVKNQMMIIGISKWSINTLASLIYHQISSGYIRFRFWYKVVKSGFIYTDTTISGSKIGSTAPILNNIITKDITYNGALEEIISFLQGRGNRINGKVIYYWISKRLG